MKLFNQSLLLCGDIEGSILVHSFEEYKNLGGKRDMFDCYAFLKERAKQAEYKYVSFMDQSLSGIPVSEDGIRHQRYLAQALWYILHLWFNRVLRVVDFNSFDLDEFNKL